MAAVKAHYSADDIEARLLLAIRAAGLNPEERLSPVDLAPLDQFHTGGLITSLELLELAKIVAADRVLDLGAGLGGPARLLASTCGCGVQCVEMSPDYCAGARLLNRLTGLDGLVTVREGSAVELPFPDRSFDVVWMQNVGMSIADKTKLYAEIRRVLEPGGRFAFQEITAGDTATTYFPLPWATHPADSVLVTIAKMRSLLDENRFVTETFEDIGEEHLRRTTLDAPPNPLSLGVFVDNLPEKAANSRRSLQEGQVRFVRGLFRAR
jgi:sarcosine/dimethylglycine N-methyltransferase